MLPSAHWRPYSLSSRSVSSLADLFLHPNETITKPNRSRNSNCNDLDTLLSSNPRLLKWCQRANLPTSALRHTPSPPQDSALGRLIFTTLLTKTQLLDADRADLLLEMAESGVFPRGTIQLSQLISKLCRSGFTYKAWDFVHTVKKGGGLVDVSSCNTLLTGLQKSREFERMNLLFSEMRGWSVRPDEFTYAILLSHLCKSGRVGDALKLLDKLLVRRSSSVVLFNVVVSGMCKEGRVEEGLALLERMRADYGCSPNTITYNSVIDGFCKAGEADASCRLFAKMEEEGVPVSMVTVNTIVDGMCRVGRIGSALEFFRERRSVDAGLSGDAVTYCTLIGGFLHANNVNKAMDLFDEMLRGGHKPDAILYHTLVSGLAQAGKVEEAASVASQMQKDGFSIDVKCYNVLISGFSKKKRQDKMRELLDEMAKVGLKPNQVTYNTLIASSSKAGDFPTADRLLKEMVGGGYKPSVVTYGALIHGHCRAGNLDEAMKIFRSMTDAGVPPNSVIYAILIRFLSEEKEVGAALSFLNEMRAQQVPASTATYNSMFRCLYGRNLFHEACEVMIRMKEQGCKPNYVTIKILTEWFSAVGEIDKLKSFIHGNAVSDT